MRTIIAGGRECTEKTYLIRALQRCGWTPTVILSGTANGADKLGEWWAECTRTPLELYPAEWDKHGKSAGYKRNQQMADKAEALIALWDGASRGTKHMIDIATKQGLKVFVYRYTNPEQ